MKTFRLINQEARDNCVLFVRSLHIDPEKPLGVHVAPWEKIRTKEANARYWARLRGFCELTGHDADAMHVWLKAKFLGKDTLEIDGEVHEIPAQSRRLEGPDFHRYMNQVDQWMSERGFVG